MKLILIFLMTFFLLLNAFLGLFEAQGFRRSWFLGGVLNKTLVGKFNLLSDFAGRNTAGYKYSHYEDNWDYYHYLRFDETSFDFSIFMLLTFTLFAIVLGLMTYATGLVLTITGHLDSATKSLIDCALPLLGILSLPWLGLDLYAIGRTIYYVKVRRLQELSLQIKYTAAIYNCHDGLPKLFSSELIDVLSKLLVNMSQLDSQDFKIFQSAFLLNGKLEDEMRLGLRLLQRKDCVELLKTSPKLAVKVQQTALSLIDAYLTGLEKIETIKKNAKANKNKLASEHYLREYDSIQELRGGK